MGTVMIRVDDSLKTILANMKNEISKEICLKYPGLSIEIPATAASRVIAAKISGQTKINFRINKISLNKGFVELL